MSMFGQSGDPIPAKKRKAPTPESLVLKAVMQYLNICKLGKVTRNNVGMVWTGASNGSKGRPVRFGTVGQSDVTVELSESPMCVYVEVKAGNGKPSPAQLDWLAYQRTRGHLAFVAWSVQDVYDALSKAGFDNLPVPGKRRAA